MNPSDDFATICKLMLSSVQRYTNTTMTFFDMSSVASFTGSCLLFLEDDLGYSTDEWVMQLRRAWKPLDDIRGSAPLFEHPVPLPDDYQEAIQAALFRLRELLEPVVEIA